MVSYFEKLSKVIRVCAELLSLAGLLLLLYYLSSVIDFFPPSLSFGDAVKLVLLCFLAAAYYFLIVLFGLLVGAFVGVPFLYCCSRLSSTPNSFSKRCLELIRYSDLLGFYTLSIILVIAATYFLQSALVPQFIITVVASTVAFIFLVVLVGEVSGKTVIYSTEGRLVGAGFWAKFDHEYSDLTTSKISGLVLAVFCLLSPIGYLGSYETFIALVMNDAGVAKSDTSVFVESRYCPIVENEGFSMSSDLVEGFCLVTDVDILFRGIGTEVLFENGVKEGEGRLSLPAKSVIESGR